jgi:hypothetical protein
MIKYIVESHGYFREIYFQGEKIWANILVLTVSEEPPMKTLQQTMPLK